MINKTIIGLIILLSLGINQSVAQSGDRFVKVGDTTVNLRDVEVEKGLEISNKRIVVPQKNRIIVEVQKTIYKSYNNGLYIVVNDTSSFHKGGYESWSSSFIEVFDKNSKRVFTKHFPDANVVKCYIVPSGNLIVLDIGSMEREELHVYDGEGNLIEKLEKYNNEIETSYLNNIIAVTSEDRENGVFNTRFFLDGVLQSKSLTFTEEEPIISFSSNEVIIKISNDGMCYLYNLELELVKEFYSSVHHVYVFNNGKHYKRIHRIDKIHEVREFNTDRLLFSKDSISYKGVSKPIYFAGTVHRGDHIFYTAYFGKTLVFNFYDINGNFISSDTTDSFMGMSKVKIIKDTLGFKILNSYEH